MRYLVFLHILIIAITNLLVQFPFTLFGFHTTWGAFSYPLIFIITDFTVRLSNAQTARKVIIKAMLPGLCISYLAANGFHQTNLTHLFSWNFFAFRIAIASFSAYMSGQLMDVLVFQTLRNKKRWWIAPSMSSLFGNITDTFIFFFIAFYHSNNAFFANHWPEIAGIDLLFKLAISFGTLIPLYGLFIDKLMILNKKIVSNHEKTNRQSV